MTEATLSIYTADRYRVTKVKSAPQPTVPYDPQRRSPLAQLQQKMLPSEIPTPFDDLTAGVPEEMGREEVLRRAKPLANGEPMRALECLFLADWLEVEAWSEQRQEWVPVGKQKPTAPQAEQRLGRRAKMRPGRKRIEDDPVARQLYNEGEELRRKHPGITRAQIASRLNMAESTYRRYVSRFRSR